MRDERFCLDEVFYLSVFAEAAGIVGFIRILIPFGYVGVHKKWCGGWLC